MSTRDNTFIDAYGLDLNEEPPATRAEPIQRPVTAVQGATLLADTGQGERSYRFDAAARHRPLRGPHFDMRRIASQTTDAVSAWNSFDASVIDVGAAWAPSPPAVQPALEKPSAIVPPNDVTAPVAVIEAADVKETTDTPPTEQPAAQVSEAAVPKPSLPVIESKERFAPVWEVDRFNWPSDIEQLFIAQAEYFDYAGKKLVAASREGLSILSITSPHSGEGCTTLALCLARAAAGAGAKVGLWDGNLRRSELGEKLGVDFASGWQTAATAEQPLAEAAITGLEERITLFPSSARPVAEIESLADDRVGQLLRAAATNFDLLIIDAGQADLGNNVELLDAAIVVRDVRRTSEAETLAVATTLRDRGVRAVGIAENFGSPQAIRAAA